MRRVIAYHRWKASWWKEYRFLHSDPAIASGISGYAHKQAAICIQMADQCALYWLPYLKEKGIVTSWVSEYEDLQEGPDRQAAVTLEEDLEDNDWNVKGDEDEIDYDDNELDMEEDEEDEDDLFDFYD
jgi:hypothetical protein